MEPSFEPRYDVLVVGGGLSGCACAALLAREGLRVLIAAGAARTRPPEVFSPATVRLIRDLALADPSVPIASRRCRGILSAWGPGEPRFHDFALYHCDAGLAVDRGMYDACLLAGVRASGAHVSYGRARVEPCGAGWRVTAGAPAVRAGFLVDATGRTGRAVPSAMAAHRFEDALVALATGHDAVPAAGLDDILLLEAMPDGWWYVAPRAPGGCVLVYLSDADLLPRDRKARAEHLQRSFQATRLVRSLFGEAPPFASHEGFDARTRERSPVVGGSWLAVGDAAFSTDPLSGSGTELAVLAAREGASAVARLLTRGDAGALDDFAAWSDASRTRQAGERRRAYASAAAWARTRHDSTPFWRRRRALQQSEAVSGWLPT